MSDEIDILYRPTLRHPSGCFIPLCIWDDIDIPPAAKIIWGEISITYDDEIKGSKATQAHLSLLADCTPKTTRKHLNTLISYGLLREEKRSTGRVLIPYWPPSFADLRERKLAENKRTSYEHQRN